MGTATILGTTYQTVIMPDGREWLAEHLQDDTAGGYWFAGNPANASQGRFYSPAEIAAFAYPDGWHVPTYAEMLGMLSYVPASYRGKMLSAPAGWQAGTPLASATNDYGFAFHPTGVYIRGWFYANYYGVIWFGFDDNPNGHTLTLATVNNNALIDAYYGFGTGPSYFYPVRLVRDLVTETPIISPASGTYVDPLEVTITCATENAVIHYTTDGSEPDEDSPIYTGPIDFRSLTGTGTVKAIAYSTTLPPSSVATANYTFKLKVFIQPESGGYSDYIKCSIRTNHTVPETVVYYTTDGSTPTEASLVYSEPFTITPPYSGEFVVKAFAVNASFVTSDIETESYYYKAPSPIDKASLTLETGLEGFNPITGKFNRLGCSGAVLLGGNLAWELTDTEYELFAGWIAFCGGEESRLTIPMTTGDVELPHVVQLLELLSAGRDTGVYSLSANAKIITRPFPDGFSWQGWAGALYGPPATYPTELPSPQWGFSTAPQALFVATGGVSTAARLRQARGSVLKASWKLSGAQFDYWLAWFCWSLGFGRRKFVFDQAGVGPWRCQFVEDPKLNIDGVNFTVTATLFYVETGT